MQVAAWEKASEPNRTPANFIDLAVSRKLLFLVLLVLLILLIPGHLPADLL